MNDKSTYIVTGYMRTGTSMMMRALEAGGLEAVYRQSRNDMKARLSDEHYDANVGGLYELEQTDYRADGFPRQYAGKLIKMILPPPTTMAVMDDVRIVVMRRDAEEIRQSYLAFFNRNIDTSEVDARMERMIEELQNRKDVKALDVFWYRDVVAEPLKHFELLKAHGWNIKPQKCAEVVNPGLCRFKREELTIGVI